MVNGFRRSLLVLATATRRQLLSLSGGPITKRLNILLGHHCTAMDHRVRAQRHNFGSRLTTHIPQLIPRFIILVAPPFGHVQMSPPIVDVINHEP
jgi:hypothetical protein